MAVLDEIRAYLALNVAGLVNSDGATRNLFQDELPDQPDAAVVVREYGPPPPVYTFGTAAPPVELRSVQVQARATTTEAARNKAMACWTALEQAGDSVGSHSYLRIEPNQYPFPMSLDSSERPLFGFSCTVYRDP